MTEPELRRPYQPGAQPPVTTDYAQLGLNAGLSAIVTSVIAGAVGYGTGNKAFYDKMFRFRMVVVVSTALHSPFAQSLWALLLLLHRSGVQDMFRCAWHQ